MSKPLVIEELPYDPEFAQRSEQAARNRHWFSEHAAELGIFKLYRGRYVGVAGGELFVADSAPEIDRLIGEKYPDEWVTAHVQYIPREKLSRIYAC